MITTTLNRIRKHSPCHEGWAKLLRHLGKTQADDKPLPFAVILESNGLDDALWCCRAEPQHAKEWRLFAVSCARRVQHLMTDKRSIDALDVAERHAHGNATDSELAAARAAAWDAAGAAAGAAGAAAWAAARAAAWDSALDSAWAAAGDSALAAAWDSAWAAAGDSALAAAWDSARAEIAADFARVVGAKETQ